MTIKISQGRLFGFLVATAAALVYLNSLGNGFTLDDNQVLLNNPVLKGSISSLFSTIDTTSDTQLLPYYRPFTYLTFWLEGRLHGFNPLAVHFVNVLLHAVNAVLVFQLARNILSTSHAALFAGLLFAVHPLHTEGVNFIAGGRNTMLACCFILLTWLLHHRSISRPALLTSLGASLCFLTGLFSKETTMAVLPFLLALELPSLWKTSAKERLRSLARLLPYAACALFYLILRGMTLSKLGIQSGIFGAARTDSINMSADLGTRLLNNLYIIPRYLLTVINPSALATHYVVPDDLNLLALPLLVSWLGIIGGLAWLLTRGRTPGTLFGLSWLVLFWLPVSGIIYFPSAPLADRYLYIPMLGLWLIIGEQTFRTNLTSPASRRYVTVATTVILIILAALTIRRNMDWKNNITLYSRFVEQYPDNIHAQAGLGSAYYLSKNEAYAPLAIKQFESVLNRNPYFPMINTFLGNIMLNHNDLEGALLHYNKAVMLMPNDKEARINRAITLEKLGQPAEALKDYRYFVETPGLREIAGARAYAEERLRALSQLPVTAP